MLRSSKSTTTRRVRLVAFAIASMSVSLSLAGCGTKQEKPVLSNSGACSTFDRGTGIEGKARKDDTWLKGHRASYDAICGG